MDRSAQDDVKCFMEDPAPLNVIPSRRLFGGEVSPGSHCNAPLLATREILIF